MSGLQVLQIYRLLFIIFLFHISTAMYSLHSDIYEIKINLYNLAQDCLI